MQTLTLGERRVKTLPDSGWPENEEIAMITTVQEGIEKYKKAVSAYRAQHVRMVAACNIRASRGDWTLPDGFHELDQRARDLKGMAEVLGLSTEEKAAIDKECGMKIVEEASVA